MVKIGSGAKRDIGDIQLSRYACYLIIQNADPSKEVVAFGQTYFAVQARKQELLEEAFEQLKSEDEKRIFLRREMAEHKSLLISTLDHLEADQAAGIFTNYPNWTTRYGTELSSINDAVAFLPFHEGLHIGAIVALRKMVGA